MAKSTAAPMMTGFRPTQSDTLLATRLPPRAPQSAETTMPVSCARVSGCPPRSVPMRRSAPEVTPVSNPLQEREGEREERAMWGVRRGQQRTTAALRARRDQRGLAGKEREPTHLPSPPLRRCARVPASVCPHRRLRPRGHRRQDAAQQETRRAQQRRARDSEARSQSFAGCRAVLCSCESARHEREQEDDKSPKLPSALTERARSLASACRQYETDDSVCGR